MALFMNSLACEFVFLLYACINEEFWYIIQAALCGHKFIAG